MIHPLLQGLESFKACPNVSIPLKEEVLQLTWYVVYPIIFKGFYTSQVVGLGISAINSTMNHEKWSIWPTIVLSKPCKDVPFLASAVTLAKKVKM